MYCYLRLLCFIGLVLLSPLLISFTNAYEVSNSKLGPRFDGVGAISGGGATSRLLPSYDSTKLGEIFDYLFLPNFGAAYHWLKVEIGGDALATEGSEPSHARTLEELNNPNYKRGYEWMLMTEAKKRNPNIKLYGLSWTWPGYLGKGNPWVNPALTANYTVSWVKGAKSVYGLDIDVLGIWNERAFSADYAKALRSSLDKAGFSNTQILCDDSKYACAANILSDKTLAAAIGYLGGHSAPTAQASQTGKPIWFSEDFHAKGGDAGGAKWANQINTRFIQYNITATLAWNAVDAFYRGLAFDDTGLMNARCPWSGEYEVLATIWATAHTTQFTQPGWYYLPVNSGSGMLTGKGSYVTYVDKKTNPDFTIVIEKFHTDGTGVAAENAQFCLGGGLNYVIGKPLNVWTSSFDHSGNPSFFVKAPSVTPDKNGCFNIQVNVDTMWTVTSLSVGNKGAHPQPPTCGPFPLPYQTSFDNCNPPSEADYFSDISGSWECVEDPSTHNIVMRLQSLAKPVSWEAAADTTPVGVFGDRYWRNVKVTVDVRLNGASDSFMLAVRANFANTTDHDALDLEYVVPGLWLAFDTSGSYSLFNQANQGKSLMTGHLPTVPTRGTWHTFTLTVQNEQLSATMDSKEIFSSVNVSAYGATGWVGYGAMKWGHQPDFDNFKVE